MTQKLLEKLITVSCLDEKQKMALGPVITSAHALGWTGWTKDDLEAYTRLDGTGVVERFSQIMTDAVNDLVNMGMDRREASDLVTDVFREAKTAGDSLWRDQQQRGLFKGYF